MILLAVGLALAGSWLLVAPVPALQEPREASPRSDSAMLRRLRVPLSVFALVGCWAVLGGGVGLVAGSLAAWFSGRVLSSAEGPAARRRREQTVRDLPVAVDLIAAALAAGAAVDSALVTVADALGGSIAEELSGLHHRLVLGADPVTVWRQCATHPQLGPLGRCVARSHESGASVADSVVALAEELRADGRADVEARARAVEVRATAPLGVCFLPAFMLTGVVPLIAGLASTLTVFR